MRLRNPLLPEDLGEAGLVGEGLHEIADVRPDDAGQQVNFFADEDLL